MPKHGPYPPKTASLGGVPTKSVDIPLAAVFLALFIGGAASHMTILQLNLRKGHKFLMSGVLFGFCMARIATYTMRIVWACYPHNVNIGIAAQVLVVAGVILLYIINLIFAQRILRAAHPHFGWHKAVSRVFMLLYVLVIVMLLMVVPATVYSFFTLDQHRRNQMRDLQLTSSTYYMFVSFLPIPMIAFGLLLPRNTRVEKFGQGRWRTKIRILLLSSTLLCLGAAYRTGTSFKTPRPIAHPPNYYSKAAFWCVNPGVEIIVVWLYIIVRVDRRFHVPNGSKGPGWYSGAVTEAGAREKSEGGHSSESRIIPEEELFDEEPSPNEDAEKREADTMQASKDLEAGKLPGIGRKDESAS
ncbi:MAG: hypothetical protein Q9227_005843 [Pyrenula ochraceoflavens]